MSEIIWLYSIVGFGFGLGCISAALSMFILFKAFDLILKIARKKITLKQIALDAIIYATKGEDAK